MKSESYRFGDRKTGRLEIPLEYTTYHRSGIVVLFPTNRWKRMTFIAHLLLPNFNFSKVPSKNKVTCYYWNN